MSWANNSARCGSRQLVSHSDGIIIFFLYAVGSVCWLDRFRLEEGVTDQEALSIGWLSLAKQRYDLQIVIPICCSHLIWMMNQQHVVRWASCTSYVTETPCARLQYTLIARFDGEKGVGVVESGQVRTSVHGCTMHSSETR